MDLRNDNPLRPGAAGARSAERHRDAPTVRCSKGTWLRPSRRCGSGSAQTAVRLAFEFLVLTVARSGEVRLATWDEIDAAGAVWTISGGADESEARARVLLCGRPLI